MIVERRRDAPAALHALEPPDDGRRRLWVLEASSPAVVLGSTQSESVVDRAAAARLGAAVVRRRSGGGAVWVGVGDPVWVDVIVPRADPAWDDDVGRSFLPVGRAWAEALADVGITGTTVHDGPMVRTEWSPLVCFAGTGPGEVRTDAGKLVGISQRRTRAGARFQCALPRVWDPAPLAEALVDPPPPAVLAAAGDGIGDVDLDELVRAFVAAFTDSHG